MTYLIDTCIISKLRKEERIKQWILSHSESEYYISVLTLGEIQAGISKLSPHIEEERKKKTVFENWLLGELIPRFKNRVLSIDYHTALIWGVMRGEMQRKGHLLPIVDALIAATAIQHNLILVTDNVKDFVHTNAHLLNPLILVQEQN